MHGALPATVAPARLLCFPTSQDVLAVSIRTGTHLDTLIPLKGLMYELCYPARITVPQPISGAKFLATGCAQHCPCARACKRAPCAKCGTCAFCSLHNDAAGYMGPQELLHNPRWILQKTTTVPSIRLGTKTCLDISAAGTGYNNTNLHWHCPSLCS